MDDTEVRKFLAKYSADPRLLIDDPFWNAFQDLTEVHIRIPGIVIEEWKNDQG